jgi:hypothetical protein
LLQQDVLMISSSRLNKAVTGLRTPRSIELHDNFWDK